MPEALGQSWGQKVTGMLEGELCLFPRVGYWMSRVAVLALGPFTRLGEASTAAGGVGKVVTILFWQKRAR